MKILVIGGTGKVGTEVVQALLRRGESVRVLTRNKEAKLGVASFGDIRLQETADNAYGSVVNSSVLIWISNAG